MCIKWLIIILKKSSVFSRKAKRVWLFGSVWLFRVWTLWVGTFINFQTQNIVFLFFRKKKYLVRSRLFKNQFRNSLHFVLLKNRSRSEDWLWSIIKIYFLYSYAIKCQSFKQSHLSGVSEIRLVHRSTFICKTPGYHHLSAASNAVTRDYSSHNPTIWSKIYLNLFKNVNKASYKKIETSIV